MNNNKKKKEKKIIWILLPFKVVIEKPIYLLWVLSTIILAPFSSWILFRISGWNVVLNSFTNSMALTIYLSLITPLLLDSIFEWNTFGKTKFSKYKSCVMGIALLMTIICCSFFCIKENNKYFNLVFVFVSIFISFYIFCIGKMELFESLKKYDSNTISDEQKQRNKEIANNISKKKDICVEGETLKI